MECIFKNDNNAKILLNDDELSIVFKERKNHEEIFRQINTFLINNNIINGNFIDLGAWIGDNSIPWAKNINNIVYAIDPSPKNCEFMRNICGLNGIKNIKIIEKAISNKNEILSTNGSLNHCSFFQGTKGRTNVSAVSLDYLFETNEIENIGYIHLDVEGMESKVIEGSQKIIYNFQPIISFEQHLNKDNYKELSKYLNSQKYVVFLIDERLLGCRPDCRNFIAFPEKKINEQIIKNINDHIGRKILILIE